MTEAIRALLKRSLLTHYESLMARLTRRLGSPDLAGEALHETYLRLERPMNVDQVANAEAYIYRAALNTATNIRTAQTRRLSPLEIDALLEIPDEGPDQARIVEARAEMARLEKALAELPERCRAIFRAALLEDIPYEDLAQRHDVTVRTVHNDIRRAIEHCGQRLGRETLFALGRRQLSRT